MSVAEGTRRETYHHGDLRTAMIDAAEAELTAGGISRFSLRRVAARVGVSHSAPSHHFGDTQGLLVALATRAFQQMLATMQARSAGISDPVDSVTASGLGYIDFALARPSMFRLIFGSDLICGSPEFDRASEEAFGHFAKAISAVGPKGMDHEALREKVYLAWTVTHGFAEMLLAGRLDCLRDEGNARIERMYHQAVMTLLLERPKNPLFPA